MAEHSVRAVPGGGLALHFDPGMTVPILAAPAQDVDMWPVWDAITVPMLTIRGAESDLLLDETLRRMAGKSETHVLPGVGHAPALMDAATIAVIRGFLEA